MVEIARLEDGAKARRGFVEHIQRIITAIEAGDDPEARSADLRYIAAILAPNAWKETRGFRPDVDRLIALVMREAWVTKQVEAGIEREQALLMAALMNWDAPPDAP